METPIKMNLAVLNAVGRLDSGMRCNEIFSIITSMTVWVNDLGRPVIKVNHQKGPWSLWHW